MQEGRVLHQAPQATRKCTHLQCGGCDVAGRQACQVKLVAVVSVLDEAVGHAHGAELEPAIQQACTGEEKAWRRYLESILWLCFRCLALLAVQLSEGCRGPGQHSLCPFSG